MLRQRTVADEAFKNSVAGQRPSESVQPARDERSLMLLLLLRMLGENHMLLHRLLFDNLHQQPTEIQSVAVSVTISI